MGECTDCRRTFRVVAGAGTTSIADDDLDARLIIKSGPQRVGEQLLLRGGTAVEAGKLPGKPIELVGTLVSRNHCRFVRAPKSWRVEDLKSTNGLFVNNKRVASADLKVGDCVRVGDFELEYAVPPAESGAPSLDDVDDLYELSEEPSTVRLPPMAMIAADVPELQPGPGAIPCPSCGKLWPAKAKICVGCGINIHTGKALLVSSEIDEDALHIRTENVVRAVSWILRFGLFPVASEGYGSAKPYAVWGITAATILVTVLVWISNLANLSRPGMGGTQKALVMWGGHEPTARDVERLEDAEFFDESSTYTKKLEEYKAHKMPEDEARLKAYNELPAEDQFYGDFHYYQLITNGFLHAGIMHLVGNLVFLLVFGSRVNALIGQWRTAVLYFVLLIAASAAEWISLAGGSPVPALGASGAIMGLAGMYFVLFPVHRVFMVIWARFGLFTGFRIAMKIWSLRGFWVVLFYIAFDVVATVFGSKDGVAHWAHLGGFIAGAVLGLILLLTRQVDAKGGDILSAMLGRRAWALLGKPGERPQRLESALA
jgi:membrane associated rhomboid family serine protease